MTPADLDRSLESIYARIPSVPCQQLCQECCGPISLEVIEYVRIFGKQPVPSEFELFGRVPVISNPLTGECPKLGRDGNCRVYDKRPAICRLYGAVKAMRCPFGCQPTRWLTDKEAHAILQQVRDLDALERKP